MASGIRLDVSKFRRKMARKERAIEADNFKPELARYATDVLNEASHNTPVRDLGIIQAAQNRQYDARINCIPSSHQLTNPSLRVNGAGQHWLFVNGRWFLANEWKLPNQHWAAYQELLQERHRRMETPRKSFIQRRAQARFLYRKTWTQIGDSLGVKVSSAGQVRSSVSRRKPSKEPPKAYGQWRGGKRVLSIAVYNPFLEIPSRYKPFSGKAIFAAALAKHRARFVQSTQSKMKRTLAAA